MKLPPRALIDSPSIRSVRRPLRDSIAAALASSRHPARRPVIALSTALIATITPAHAQDATWLLVPGSNDWNTAANWAPAAVPTATSIATFGDSSRKALTISQDTSVGSFQLTSPGYSFALQGSSILTVGGNNLDSTIDLGLISGTGSLAKVGSGVLTLSAPNSYAGLTTINAGTLQIGNGGNSGGISGSVSVMPGATVAFNRGDSPLFAQTISGGGSLAKLGSGTLILSGDNTYTGGTTISGGTLQIGNGGTTGSLAGNIVNNGALSFNRSNGSSFGGDISGSGGLTVTLASGTLYLTGANSYIGGTTITKNTLSIGNGGTTGSIVGNVVDNASLTFNRSDGYSFGGEISGTGGITALGGGTITLTGKNSYTTQTRIQNGTTLSVAANENLGVANARMLLTNGSTLQLTNSFTLARAIGFNTPGVFNVIDTQTNTNTISGMVSGTEFGKAGSGTLILNGSSPGFTSAISINGGTLQLGDGTATGGNIGGTGLVTVADNAELAFNRDTSHTFARPVTGDGALRQQIGTLTLTADNTYSGGSIIAAGSTLQVGDGGSTGSLGIGDVTNNGALVLDRSGEFSYGGSTTGGGTVTKIGASTLTLSGTQASTGLTTVANGALLVNGSVSGDVQVDSGATLGGGDGDSDEIGGTVTVAAGAHLAPGNSAGTLRVGNLVLNQTSQLDYELGLANVFGGGVNDLTIVTGDLTLDGQLNVSDIGGFGAREVLAGGAFGPGVYRLFEYGGALFDQGLDLNVPGFSASQLLVQAGSNQVNLIVVAEGFTIQHWDGANAGGLGTVDGGTSIWDSAATSWTTADGSINAPWQSGFAVFTGQAGTVTLGANTTFTGMQFATEGYRIDGAGFDLQAATDNTPINVNSGTAIIDARIVDASGPSRLSKTGDGTLILDGANTYSGGTTISGGALQVSADGNLGAASGGLLFNDGALITTGTFESTRAVTLASEGGTFSPAADTTLTLAGTISGSGQLRKRGDGAVVLSGANTFSGGTLLSAGVLQVSSDAALGDSNGSLELDGGTLRLGANFDLAETRAIALDSAGSIDTNGFTSTIAQAVGGAGALTKLGAGTLTLAGDNTYAGTTTIGAGTLQIGDGGTSGSITGDIANNSALIFNRGDELAFGGVISGSGSVTKAGEGTLILNADQTYTGGTTISSGSLQLGDGEISGNLVGSVLNNATLAFDRSDDVTFGGIISGTGTLTKNGSGTLILEGANTFTGRTTINAGTLQIGNGGSTGNIAGNITNNDGSLIFNRNDSITFAGVVDGTGTMTQAGNGSLILTQNQAFTGGTTITAGTLQLGNGGTSGSVIGGIANNGTLIFNRSDDIVHGEVIDGSGSVVKEALNVLTLTGASTYTGPTTVNAGRLQVEGSIASPVNVMSAATLGGNGSVGTVVNGGHVSPGASLGTLTVAGDFSQSPSGTLDIELDDHGGVDALLVSGTATLAGSVDYLPDPASTFATDQIYTYLSAGSVTGTFSNSSQAYAGVTFDTVYHSDSVQVQITSKPLIGPITDPGSGGKNLVSCIGTLDLARSATLGTEATATLAALVAVPVDSLVEAAIDTCPRDPSVIPSAVHGRTSARFSQLNNRIAQVNRSIENPSLAALDDSYRLREGVGFWVRSSYQDGQGEQRDLFQQGYDSINRSMMLGIDVALKEGALIGGYLARDEMDVSYHGPTADTGETEVTGWTLGAYGSYWSENHWFMQGMIEYGWHRLESVRDISLNILDRQAAGNRDARGFATTAGAGYNITAGQGWLIQPQLNVSYERFADDAYAENGAQSLDLTYSQLNADTFRTEAGLTVRKVLANLQAQDVTAIYVYANYIYDDALDNRNITAQFEMAGPFEISGNGQSRDGIRYGLGFESTWANNASLQLILDAEDYGEIENLSATLQLRKQF